ncbi:hypothetical protein SSX86_024778 [Deinandra increscens subsp. villosa]|uniref:ATP-dependent DNA helicase n=1 Tax=Deinandra increscens subsp. villosa TaxID=3103831 RepID=A0AAP0CBA8_9ASTR
MFLLPQVQLRQLEKEKNIRHDIMLHAERITQYPRSEYPSTIQPYFGCYNPLSYPLFFTNGETGWHQNIPRQGASFSEVYNNQDDNDEEMEDSLNADKKFGYDEIINHVNKDLPGVFFIDGPGGTGKTVVYKSLLAEVRSRGLIALATTSSGVAANNLPGGRTTHSRFKIQAVNRTLQDIIGVRLPFGGKIMVMGGDFRQVLPVVKCGTRAQIVDASLRMSPLWSLTRVMRLTINMRALNDPWFSDFLLRFGDGTEESIEGSFIRIPDSMTIPSTVRENSIKEQIDAIFPSLQDNMHSSDYIISRVILSTKNSSVDEINEQMIDNFEGEEKVYYSFDEAEDDCNNLYPVEFLNMLNVSGVPPHKRRLKVGCPIILLRNIDPSHGLCNGTRLICKGFQRKFY